MRHPRSRPAAAPAFTLLEVLIVIALLGMMTALLWPDFGAAQRSERLTESARRMNALIQMCRARAMLESRQYRITIRQDGTLHVTRQLDPLLAPQVYFPVRRSLTDVEPLLEKVWVESLEPLPDGITPLFFDVDEIRFADIQPDPTPVTDLEAPYDITIEPDGACPTLRWTLRDAEGFGLKLTLDGRLGRVNIEPAERIDPGAAAQPEAIEYEDPYANVSEADLLQELQP